MLKNIIKINIVEDNSISLYFKNNLSLNSKHQVESPSHLFFRVVLCSQMELIATMAEITMNDHSTTVIIRKSPRTFS